jgi:hypothetical protein
MSDSNCCLSIIAQLPLFSGESQEIDYFASTALIDQPELYFKTAAECEQALDSL